MVVDISGPQVEKLFTDSLILNLVPRLVDAFLIYITFTRREVRRKA